MAFDWRCDLALLDLDEVADMHLGAEFGTRPQAGVGAEHAVRPDHRILEMAEGGNARTGPDLDVLQHAVGADLDRIAELDLAFEDAADVDGHIAAMAQFATHVDARRIGQAHAGDQQLVGQVALVLALQFGQLHLAVDPQHLPFAFRLRGTHRQALGDRQRDDVGQVVLALGVVVLQLARASRPGGPSAWP